MSEFVDWKACFPVGIRHTARGSTHSVRHVTVSLFLRPQPGRVGEGGGLALDRLHLLYFYKRFSYVERFIYKIGRLKFKRKSRKARAFWIYRQGVCNVVSFRKLHHVPRKRARECWGDLGGCARMQKGVGSITGLCKIVIAKTEDVDAGEIGGRLACFKHT
jgi:hypothetical protein